MNGRGRKAKGSRYEREVVAHLHANGYPNAERKLAGKAEDTGDIANGPPNWTLELKNHATWRLAAWLDEAELEAQHSGNEYGAVVVRRAGIMDRGRDYVVVSLDTFLAALGRGSAAE